ncbi:unnamed protein product [Mycena citricolor]|uniref:Nucleoporin Nup133/Nup155-like C-terminal domain-containing protein n=1 Tax=Mycena citricolor TaxID=2018698 RepID=A0AAD2HMB3_9AGAR|nr:unnamed protein product [Mycena citricolor]
MATFSPSPAPRRSLRHKQVVNSPPRRTRVAGSRLATPRAASFANESVASVSIMDVDSAVSDRSFSQRIGPDTIFAKSKELTVSFYASLPVEVKQILKNADFLVDAYTGDIDTLTGFALVASAQTCFVWQHAQAVKGIPTCYIFSCPDDEDGINPPCMGSSHTHPLNYSTTDLGLSEDEVVTNFSRADFWAALPDCADIRWRQTSPHVAYLFAAHFRTVPLPTAPFVPGSLQLAYLSDSECGKRQCPDMGEQTSTGGGELWALVDTRIQRWEMKTEGWEQLLLEEDIASLIKSALIDAFGAGIETTRAPLDLELVDIAVDGQGHIVILASYAGREEPRLNAMDVNSGFRRIYALVRISSLGDLFKVDDVLDVPYQSTSASGAPVHPRIRLLSDGRLFCVQFGDAVALCAQDSDYRNRIELKSASDRTLGVGVVHRDDSVLILAAGTMIKAQIDMENVDVFNAKTGRTALIKSIMTQAVVYGSLPDNPLQFSFPPDVDAESLMQGAEQLSEAVLQSNSELARNSPDLSVQLTSRKERLSWLIHFINDNAVLGKMSQRSRQRLAVDAEKLYSAYQLWKHHNGSLSSDSVLNETIEHYMERVNDINHDDVTRAFFRLRISNMGLLLAEVPDVITRLAQSQQRELAELLPEACHIVLDVLSSAIEYRDYNLGVYGIELPMIDPWTSSPAMIALVLGLFESTTKLLGSPRSGIIPTSNEPSRDQLPALATVLFSCIQERMDWLSSPISAEIPGVDRERNELKLKFDSLRPEVLETLRKFGHERSAFDLAEKYRDFSTLAALCHQDKVYPADENPNAERILGYIAKFKDDFTTALYRWYIQHGELRVMFAQENGQQAYMDRFFAAHPDPSISWIHDLGQRGYAASAEALLSESEQTTHLQSKQLMLSIGKLAHLAHVQETADPVQDSTLDRFHNDLDFVSVHHALLEEFQPIIDSLRSRRTMEEQIDAIVKKDASRLAEQPAMTQIFRDLVRQLLQGSVLSMEDTIDVLTLKDNVTTVEDYTTALHILSQVQNLPEARKASAFRSIWRRVYLHDDWDALQRTTNVSDAELNERFRSTALFATLTALLSENAPEGYDIGPDMALIIPTETEIKSRWPGLSTEQVEAMVRDYSYECDKLGDYDLAEVYDRIKELAAEGIVWQS